MALIFSPNIVGVKEEVSDELFLLDPTQIPLVSAVGFSSPVFNTTHEWVEDEMFATSTTMNDAGGIDDNPATTTITVTDGSIFRIGHVVAIEDELVKVTNVVTNDLTVERAYGSSTIAAHADALLMTILFTEGVEGADARAARYKARTRPNNITQIFDDSIEISGTSMAVAQYAIRDMYNYEKAKKLVELGLQLENSLINGLKHTAGYTRNMGGMRQYVATNVTAASAADITDDMVNDLAQTIKDAGGLRGGRYVLMVPSKQRRKMSKMFDDELIVTQSETSRGTRAEQVVTDLGTFPIMVNDNLRADEAFLIDLNRISISPLNGRSFFHKYLGEQGDYQKGMIVGEYTMQFEQEKAHGRISGLSV